MAAKVPVRTFNNGKTVPVIGLGTWKSAPGDVTEAVKYAIDIGYRHFDCAYVYGNEKEVGEGIAAKIEEGIVKREDLFITSKIWNTFHKPDLVRGALLESLKNLNLTYLDLYLIHWPLAYKEGDGLFPEDEAGQGHLSFSNVDFVDTWKAMEPLVGEGLVKSIGVSNFNMRQISRLLDSAVIKPVTNQVECHPYLNQSRLKDYCDTHGILITAYSPLGSPDRPWARCDEPVLLEDPKVLAIAKRLEKTPAQVLIRYQIDRGNIVIPKSVTQQRIASNFDVFDFKLSKEDMKLIDSFDRDLRFCGMAESLGHRHHPFENNTF
ncbi:hypothetical protein ABMA28_012840 [Loxostege sticticalis]|uniref:NADP-dependent oxidoreductase domain-containing protein n=1 Tax=Loxostege sticticalis TaxID=481309 RepID=A0ABD0S2X4_LOXSC